MKSSEAVSALAYTSPAETPTSDELERLVGMGDQGIIAKEEFEVKKKQLLGL